MVIDQGHTVGATCGGSCSGPDPATGSSRISAILRPMARHRLAIVRDDGDDVVVTWHRDVPLATHYVTAEDALDDVVRWMAHQPGGTRPIPIPHFPPTRTP